MRKIKKWFRYPLSCISLVILFVISFYSVYKIADYQHLLTVEERERVGSQFEYSTIFSLKGEGSAWEMAFKNLPVCVSVENISAYVNTECAAATIDILIPSQREPKYPLISGSMRDEGTDPVIVLGQELQPFTYKENGVVYFKIEGEPYRVIGYVGSEQSDLFNSKRIVYSDRMGDKLRNVFDMEKESGLLVKVCSDEEDTDVLVQEVVGSNSFHGMDTSLGADGESVLSKNLVVYTEDAERNRYLQLLGLFCIVNVVIVSELWLYERRKEIVIRVENGFSHAQIYWLMYWDILRLSFLSAGLVFVIQTSLEMVVKGKVISIEKLCWEIGTMLLCSFLLAGVVLLYPMWSLSKKTPQELFAKKGEV